MRKSLHTRAYSVLRERLILARKGAGFTQQQLAKQIGRPQSFVAKYESGERRLDLVEFLEIAAVLGVEPRKIIRAVSDEI